MTTACKTREMILYFLEHHSASGSEDRPDKPKRRNNRPHIRADPVSSPSHLLPQGRTHAEALLDVAAEADAPLALAEPVPDALILEEEEVAFALIDQHVSTCLSGGCKIEHGGI
jgi:hypothetical protein